MSYIFIYCAGSVESFPSIADSRIIDRPYEKYEDTNNKSFARQVDVASGGLVWGTGIVEIPGSVPSPWYTGG